jgi:hypothetical protein
MKATLTPAAPPAPEANQPREAASIWMGGVIAPAAQNVMGGIGTAVVAALIGQALFPAAGMLIFKIAAYAGLTTFGIACMIRAFRDEITILISAYAAGQLDATTEALRRENKRLVDEVEYLKSQGMVAHAWGAREAAERLVNDYYLAVAANVRDLNTVLAREPTRERGMTVADWKAGIQFLKNAGLLEISGKSKNWMGASEEAALAAIARHAAVSKVRVRAANGDMTAL